MRPIHTFDERLKKTLEGEANGGHAFFDVRVACARKVKLESVNVVARYEAKVLRIEERCNREMK
jgi:hypothetical protein